MRKPATALKAVPSETPKVLHPVKQTEYPIQPRTVEETLCEAYRLLAIIEYWFSAKEDDSVPYDDPATWSGMKELLIRAMQNVEAVNGALPYAASEIQPWKAGAR